MTERPDLRVRDIGSFFVGGAQMQMSGRPVGTVQYAQGAAPVSVDPNGTYISGQVYVQYVLLANSSRLPILFLNGGTFTGAMWETTPDGRPGWQRLFLDKGYSSYLTDAVGKGRASYAPFPEIFAAPPVFRPLEETWKLLRIGPRYTPDPAARETFPGVQFPIDHFDAFARQGVPRFPGQDSVELAAYDDLLDRIGRCIVVAQSSGGYFATLLASKRPRDIAAIVTVELTAVPDTATAGMAALAAVPQLILWGDNIPTSPMWMSNKETVRRYADAVNSRGGRVDILDLPARGVAGNSHQMMMDCNNDVLADLVAAWLDDLPDMQANPR